MSVIIKQLQEGQAGEEYEHLLNSVETTLLYASLKYCKFLQRILPNSEPIYLIAYETDRMVGALPSFIKHNASYGNVLNSLPFYGSNGGMVVSNKASDTELVKHSLMDAFSEVAEPKSVVASTLISNPLDEASGFYEAHSHYTLRDERIGQITPLPTDWHNKEELQNLLMTMVHQKTRNCIRKAQKSNIVVCHSGSLETMHTLASLHRQNIEAIGGLYKPLSIFIAIREIFCYDKDYRVYLAQKDGVTVAALLVLFYNKTVEYYTPAALEDYRTYQPLSLLIYESMKDATQRGFKYWNWGGTWLTQKGVYFFKSRWGTKDKSYFYYTRVFDDSLLRRSKEFLLQEYPHFYVVPFAHLI
jgi:hypothetical protein